MPLDIALGAQSRRSSPAASQANRKLVAAWLFAVCFMIWVMVGIGGYTRDSGSGLSIMDWEPIIGTLPPLTDAAWDRVFSLYQTIPQYQILHQGMDLAGFKALFWPEYIHRLWGRLIGLVFFVPLIGFIVTGRIEKRLIPWLVLLFLLGGLQGAIGWFMVASGFDPNSVAVEPWRLSLHFSAAMFLFSAVLWTALTVLRPVPVASGLLGLKAVAVVALVCLVVTLFAGTFVSGTHAITVYNPVTQAGMGQPPADYFALSPWWLNLFANKAAVLFDHQALAAITLLATLTAATLALRAASAPKPVRDAGLAIAGLVVLQFILGVSALVSGMIDLGVAHQMNAVLLLGSFLWLLHGLRAAR
jgi:cytochrome c oxidase assembly protein subunit 15